MRVTVREGGGGGAGVSKSEGEVEEGIRVRKIKTV
jgi:hypothetical protein